MDDIGHGVDRIGKTEPRGRHAEQRRGGSDPQVAGRRDAETAAEADAPDGRDGGHRAVPDCGEGGRIFSFVFARLFRAAANRIEFGDIGPGAEVASGARQNDGTHRRIACQLFKQGCHGLPHRLRHGVLAGRFVDCDGHDAVFGACHLEKLGLRDFVIRHATNPIERAFRKMRFI